ncbi:MAG: NUDIX hydrolase [Candidatus Eremiobacteraeota bacterium]|nr:NUDIX hydrolase [Candidatus Eremiobacteraeota bacterium]MBV9647710.1 NUDIX hydrolase [Candidatus Eremiobacteraeota bacterium]
MERIELCTGILRRAGTILLVASRYPNQPRPLWGLPGGRPRTGELLHDALRRECEEETGLAIRVQSLAYVSESLDRASATHVRNTTFAIESEGEPAPSRDDVHLIDVAWIPLREVGNRISVAVVREPLLAYLAGDERRYFAYRDAGITIQFYDEP